MKTSQRGIDLIHSYEQLRLKAYMPTPNDRLTIGWGSTGPDIKMGMTWTKEQADARFARDLTRFEQTVRDAIADTPTTQNQFDAMVSLCYNIGGANFTSSTLVKKHNARDYAGAAEQFGRWNKQAGKVLNGLTRRRAEEAALYRSK